MATHARIFQHENTLVECTAIVAAATLEIKGEADYMQNGAGYPENAHCWSVLGARAESLRDQLETLLEAIARNTLTHVISEEENRK